MSVSARGTWTSWSFLYTGEGVQRLTGFAEAAGQLEELGVVVDVVPESDFFMKPMVSALMSRLG